MTDKIGVTWAKDSDGEPVFPVRYEVDGNEVRCAGSVVGGAKIELTDAEREQVVIAMRGWDTRNPAVIAAVESIVAARNAQVLRDAANHNDEWFMDCWWTASDDGWAVPDDMPGKFLREVTSRLAAEYDEKGKSDG